MALLGDVGAWGVKLHDNDLVPIDATPGERDRLVRDFSRTCEHHGLVVPMVTTNLFTDPAFKDGAFTANDPAVRALAVQKAMSAMDLGTQMGAKILVMWGGREGTDTDGCRRPDVAIQRLREAVNFLVLLTSKWVGVRRFGSQRGVEEEADAAQFRRSTNRASR